MGRYLMFLQYLGTRYSGIQVQRVGGFARHDVKTVQGTIERHLKKLLPPWESNLYLSSRTDKKVHAYCNAVHFDFHHESRLKEQSDLDRLKFILNIQLHKAKEDIKILRIQQVHDNFVSRYAAGRNYLYRLAVIPEECRFQQALSVVERNRISVVRSPFDVDLFVKSAELLAGTHNFSAFTTLKGTQFKNPVKNVVIGLRGGQPDQGVCQHLEGVKCNFWDVHIQAKSFLYHQIWNTYRNEEDKTAGGMSATDTSSMSGTERIQETVSTDGDEKSVTGEINPHDEGDNRQQAETGGDNSGGGNSWDNGNNDILKKSVGKVT
ncbi:tRNA pseudouridine synthase-like 1 isoform X1 [Haliotis rubra]|uniref:tRNA pseudouridine synthase-like 1 isoform X1 n=1 Tax=Haliotis rubra TaxID=36100 RepID=UPI001EE581C0|nr:tRNA pseudouridine synthase-like 1 isoform X1 [Haliotis rubra]